jgi:hypothetical protein
MHYNFSFYKNVSSTNIFLCRKRTFLKPILQIPKLITNYPISPQKYILSHFPYRTKQRYCVSFRTRQLFYSKKVPFPTFKNQHKMYNFFLVEMITVVILFCRKISNFFLVEISKRNLYSKKK